MLPRYAPTYSYFDLLKGLRWCLARGAVGDLRRALARLYGVKHVFLFSRARVALYALLRAYNRPGGVLIPAYNCIVVPEAVLYAGYRPVFVDIDCSTLNMSARATEQSISSDIVAVLITHQFGIPCDVDELLRVCKYHDILVVEDAAAAIGARYQRELVGSFGDAAIVSFDMTKVVSGGVGGVLLTDDDELACKVNHLLAGATAARSYWSTFVKALAWKTATSSWIYPATQFAYRVLKGEKMFQVVAPHIETPLHFLRQCSRFSAALVLMQLERLDSNLSRRRKLAQIYTDELSRCSNVRLPVVPKDSSPAWTQFPLLVSEKAAFCKHMQRNNVDLSWTFRYSCADSFGLGGFPNARQAAQTVVGLPTYPSLSDEKAGYICSAVKSFKSGPGRTNG